ncbi:MULTISPECIES: restriction endonuclease subunit S [unclassified Lebetimonas]|uniref:restriction endonuclease subunit S n=1 Tax=unclassified Lebetimonas TaxID=2648158 RepID=UPI0004AC8161|nr:MULTISPECIES: restriction endonuclease subunit S [unclassified Lebetimonas]
MEKFIEKLKNVKVEWRKLGEIAELKRGKVISKRYLRDNKGIYPVYSSQTVNNGEIGKINTYDFDGEFVNWTTDGANAGTVFYRKGKFSITNVSGLIIINNQINLIYKFLYYWLTIEAKKHVYSGMGNPKLMSNQMAKIPIPIPPLEIQKEIVKILDTFTELTAELTAELHARKKQYEYYRDKLLTFGDEVEWKKLGEVIKIEKGKQINKSQLAKTGKYPAYNGGITYSGFTDKYNYSENTIIISQGGASAGFVNFVTTKFWANAHCYVILPKKDIVENRFIFHFLKLNQHKLMNKQHGAGIPALKTSEISNIKIPIPPLEIQKEIVKILDKFDTLANSISEGLPKEIELRKKQYEYYRNLLLDFKM